MIQSSTDVALHGLTFEHCLGDAVTIASGSIDVSIEEVAFVGGAANARAVAIETVATAGISNITLDTIQFVDVATAVHVAADEGSRVVGLSLKNAWGEVKQLSLNSCTATRCTDFEFVNVSLGHAAVACNSFHGVVLDCNHGGIVALHSCVAPITKCACEDKTLCQPLVSQPRHEVFAAWVGYAHNSENANPQSYQYPWLQPNDWRKMDFTKMTSLGVFSSFVPTDLICTAHRHSVRVVLAKYKSADWSFPPAQIGNATARSQYVDAVLSDVTTAGADGMQFDIEGFDRDPSVDKAAHRAHLVSLVAEMRAGMDKRISPSAQLSFSSSYKPTRTAILSGYDFLALSQQVNFFFIMEYQQCWGVDALNELPLSVCFASASSLTQSIRDYNSLNVSSSKLLVGFPWFAFDMPCNTSTVGSRCFLPPVPPGQSFDGWARMVPYSLAAQLCRGSCKMRRDPESGMEVYTRFENGTRRQVVMDTPATFAEKYRLVRQLGVKGVGFYSADMLDYDRAADVRAMWGALPTRQ